MAAFLFTRTAFALFTSIVAGVSFAPNVMAEGGSHSNGGGGISASTEGWVPTTSFIPLEMSGPDYAEVLGRFRKAHPEVKFGSCAHGDADVFPEFPAKLSDRMFSFFIGNRARPLSLSRLCKNRKELMAYGEFMVALYALLEDPVGSHLFQTIVKTGEGRAISVAILPRAHRIGHLKETTWFDSDAETLFWSPPSRSKNMIESMFGRGANRILKHELVHVLEKRVLGSRYPLSLDSHDRVTAIDRTLFDSSWTKSKTSVPDAFIEGLANALERDGYALEHPFMRVTGNFMALKGDGCYFLYPNSIYFGPRDIRPKLDNEIYVASAFSVLLDGLKDNGDTDLSDSAGGVFTSYRPDRAIQMIDAFVRSASLSLLDFARQFDLVSVSDIGTRWLREYYFFDLVKGTNTRDKFEVRDRPDSLFFKNELCLRDPKERSEFLTPVLEAEATISRKAAFHAYVKRVSWDDLEKDVAGNIEYFERERRGIQARYTSISRASAVFSKVAHLANLCGAEAKPQLGSLEIYRAVQSRYDTTLSLMEIFDDIQKEGCEQTLLAQWDETISEAMRIGASIQADPEAPTDLDRKQFLVQAWLRAKRNGDRNLGLLRNAVALARAFQDDPELVTRSVSASH